MPPEARDALHGAGGDQALEVVRLGTEIAAQQFPTILTGVAIISMFPFRVGVFLVPFLLPFHLTIAGGAATLIKKLQ